MILLKWFIIGLILVFSVFKAIVSILNQKHSRKPVTERTQDIYDQKRYKQWLAYSLEVNRFSLIRQGFNVVILIIFLLGPFAYLEKFISTLTSNNILQTLLFLGIYQTITTIVSLPFRHYFTFSIEERHGFNRSTKRTFVADVFKSYFLNLIIGGVIIATVNWLFLTFYHNIWIFIVTSWAMISIVLIIVSAGLGQLFFRLFNKFTPLEEGTLKSRIEELATSLNFNIKSILVMDASRRSTKSNAYFMGIGRNKEVVLFDTLIESMSDDEIIAVLAHELGHAVHKDIWQNLAQQIGLLALYAIAIGFILNTPIFFSAFSLSGIHFGFALILFPILFEPLELILGILINKNSRQKEFNADNFAAKHANGEWMISALKVLSRENLSNLNPHPLTVLLYYSHPPMNERIKSLENTC